MAWHRHGGNGGSQLSRAHEMAMYYLRRRRARPAANLNRRGESAHMLHGSGGWVGCVGQAARHRRGISFASRAEPGRAGQSRARAVAVWGCARVVGAWQGRRRRGDHRRVAILVRLSGLLGLALRVCVYVCVCLFESEVRGEAAATDGAWHGAWRMACCGAHHGVADGPPPLLCLSRLPICPSASLGAIHP
jgi:hypothetical protein